MLWIVVIDGVRLQNATICDLSADTRNSQLQGGIRRKDAESPGPFIPDPTRVYEICADKLLLARILGFAGRPRALKSSGRQRAPGHFLSECGAGNVVIKHPSGAGDHDRPPQRLVDF